MRRDPSPSVPEVGPEEASSIVDAGGVLVDVREDEEWLAGHAPGAVHIPLGRLAAEHSSLPLDQPVVAVCRSGGRSQRATAALRTAGYDAVNLGGGMQAWAAAGQPVVTEGGAPGTVI